MYSLNYSKDKEESTINYRLCSCVVYLKSCVFKLDGVGPVNNRPSIDQLHHFVPKKNKKIKNLTRDM